MPQKRGIGDEGQGGQVTLFELPHLTAVDIPQLEKLAAIAVTYTHGLSVQAG
jgi:hypothetical protein